MDSKTRRALSGAMDSARRPFRPPIRRFDRIDTGRRAPLCPHQAMMQIGRAIVTLELTASRRTLLNGLLAVLAASQSPRWVGAVAAQEQTALRIGMSAPNTTLDPHL